MNKNKICSPSGRVLKENPAIVKQSRPFFLGLRKIKIKYHYCVNLPPLQFFIYFLILRTFALYVDPLSETRSSNVYVPRDENFSEIKEFTFSVKTIYSVIPALLPSLETAIIDADLGFPYFTAIDSLFNEGINLPSPKTLNVSQGFFTSLLPRLFKAIDDTQDNLLKFETPETMDSEKNMHIKLIID